MSYSESCAYNILKGWQPKGLSRFPIISILNYLAYHNYS